MWRWLQNLKLVANVAPKAYAFLGRGDAPSHAPLARAGSVALVVSLILMFDMHNAISPETFPSPSPGPLYVNQTVPIFARVGG